MSSCSRPALNARACGRASTRTCVRARAHARHRVLQSSFPRTRESSLSAASNMDSRFRGNDGVGQCRAYDGAAWCRAIRARPAGR
jgi:hypothetical protein